jgi:4-hydroxythreonine-4-phosphate dehydrogenase
MPTCAGKFGIARPRILVAGLNPHAGEGGHMGREEIEVIAPVLERAARRRHGSRRPAAGRHAVHPQRPGRFRRRAGDVSRPGAAVLKYAAFGHGINITLGLPIIRTSVDHGTALDLAGSGRADAGSLFAAVDAAIAMATTTVHR